MLWSGLTLFIVTFTRCEDWYWDFQSRLQFPWGSTRLYIRTSHSNIYLNDLPFISKFGNLESFVDDSKVYLSCSISDLYNVVQQINEDLSKVAAWCCYHSLLINPDNVKLLVLGTRKMLEKIPGDFHVILLGKNIFPSSSAEDLG